ncbi:MAG: chitobiase/beta-hexosaminidase C-terminal domain-containing protein [Muribaculaceae bacterium]|nr:chitobiase/beta-hexosaminidase C-terminal domain-containing protein [Muribaculaceae bacterium]
MTFTTDEPTIHLAKIVFGFTSNTNVDKIEVEKGEGTWTPANHTWTGDLRQLTFKIGGNIQINTIEVYTVEGDPIELPEPELPEATKVASIKALLDANTAVESGNTTEGEFTLDFPVTVIYSEGQYNYVTDGTNNLLIYSNLGKSGLENGIVLPAGITGKYKNQNGLPELVSVAAASVGDPTDGTEVEPVATTVEDANAEGLSAYIVLEGVTVSGVNGKNFTIADEAGNTIAGYNSLGISVPEGTDLTVTGFVSIYNTTYQIAPVSITNAQGKETVATPTFNPEGGEVLAGTRVNIYTSTEGASIYYTVDGSEPTAASTLYETAVEITEAVTIKAIAVKEGCDDSEVAEATYTLKAPADATFNFASPASLSPAYPADKDDSTLEADGTNGFYANVTDVKFTDGDITVTSTKGSTDARLYYQNNGKVQLRVYNGGTTTISSDNAKLLIAKIVITYNNGSTSYNKVVAPAEGNWDKETGTWTPAEGVAGAKSVTFEYTGTQQINAIEVYTAEASGVDSIGVDGDNAPAVYYNLQGVRVDNPTPGLYIMRQGSKAIKVLVR